MNIAAFKDRDCFALLNLEARFDFKTETSISFQIGRHSCDRCAFVVKGWLDVHHPIPGEYVTKARLRIALPSQYFGFEHKFLETDQQREVIAIVFKALEIPQDEVYEAHFFTPENQQVFFVEEPGIMYTYAT